MVVGAPGKNAANWREKSGYNMKEYGPDGAAGGLKPEYTAASGPRDYGSGPTTGTRSQTTCYVRRGTGRVIY